MKTGLISIFVLPHEIDSLHLTLYNLRRNAIKLKGKWEFGLDITLCLSDTLTDWGQSELPRAYFGDKFEDITNNLCDWAYEENVSVRYDNEIMGCVSQRRHSLQYVDNYDFTLWLDTDLFFSDNMLAYMCMGSDSLKESKLPYYIITPQFTRQWDETWDVLVNRDLLGRELNDNLVADVFEIGLPDSESVVLRPIDTFKAAGGWATLISNPLLKITGIPESLGHYGLEDTYVMACANAMRGMYHAYPGLTNIKPQQFILDGLVIGENHANQSNKYLRKLTCAIDKKDEFRQIASANFEKEINNFIARVTK